MSIPRVFEIKHWIEENRKTLVLATLFFLISSTSFALGYLAAGETEHAQIVIEKREALPSATNTKSSAVTSTASAINTVKAVPKKAEVKKISEPPVVVAAIVPSPEPIPVPVVTPTIAPSQPVVTPVSEPATPSPVDTSPAITETTPSPVETSPAPVEPAQAPAPLSPLQITEVLAGTETSSDDEFIELFNPNSVSVDLTGYSIKKKTSSGNESSLVAEARFSGKIIPPQKHFLIGHDEGYAGSVLPDVTWAKSNDLAYTNNSVILYGSDGVMIAEKSWSKLEKGQSTMGIPTPQNTIQ